jgi:hypothetical protein
LPETLDTSYRYKMTSVEHWRSAVQTDHAHIRIAGVPWPTYKLIALAAGLAVLVIIGAVTASPAAAVLSGAAVASALWIVLGLVTSRRN